MISRINSTLENISTKQSSVKDEGNLQTKLMAEQRRLKAVDSDANMNESEKAKEKVRIQEVKNICKRYGKPEQSLKIEELCEFIDNSKDELLNCKKEITKILEELKKVNKMNSVLINSSLEYVNFAVNMLTETSKKPTYEAKGVQINSAQRNLFDIKL